MDSVQDSVGRRIAALRAALGLTQVQFAAVVELHPMTVSKYERGLIQPSAGTLVKIARQANVPVSTLFPEDDHFFN